MSQPPRGCLVLPWASCTDQLAAPIVTVSAETFPGSHFGPSWQILCVAIDQTIHTTTRAAPQPAPGQSQSSGAPLGPKKRPRPGGRGRSPREGNYL